MKAEYPDRLDDFRLTMSREEYNAGVTAERPLSPLRFAYLLQELEVHMQELDAEQDAQDTATTAVAESVAGLEGRLRSVEEELDAITQSVVTEAGFGLTKNGNELALANPIPGAVNVSGTITGQNGHGQFSDFASLVAGLANLRNGVVRFHCIDTTGHIEIESPDSIAENRKQYLKDLAGKIPVEEADGTLNVATAFKIAETQVVGERLASIAITQDPPVGTWLEGGYGFDTKEEFDNFISYVGGLRSDIQALLDALTNHGLVATE